MIEEKLLSAEEKAIFSLRTLFAKNDYKPYKMGKFEEYDFYVRNKDFLTSESVITFNDTNGKLMALKPDVTLSIIKNYKDEETDIKRVYYNENVYRISETTHAYKEIMQSGLECFGNIFLKEKIEVLMLALESLSLIAGGKNFVLEVSNIGIIQKLLESFDNTEAVYKCISQKAVHELDTICPSDLAAKLKKLVSINCKPEPAIERLAEICPNAFELAELTIIAEVINKSKFKDNVVFNFSIVSSMKYYNSLLFRGCIEGLSDAILSGGQYDKLFNKLGKKGGAIGFAVYLDLISELSRPKEVSKVVNVALPKGRLGDKVYEVFKKAGYPCPEIEEDSRKLIFENLEVGIRFFWVKPSDVAIYVERGAADIGVAGKDIILEYKPNVYELLDLGLGKCRMCVAAPKGFVDDETKTLRVATKFANTAMDYYTSIGRSIDIIKLKGSIEIAPILDLSDVIVDIVETGTTLKENDLEIKEVINDVSARLISNKANFNFKTDEILRIVSLLKEQIKND
ncbi:MAG: ATP phosphoribosyltransferase [Ruminococcaceae bacterium]|nr:ATP phosphoribosyltransferase [Oscillospiraceae bacterium]